MLRLETAFEGIALGVLGDRRPWIMDGGWPFVYRIRLGEWDCTVWKLVFLSSVILDRVELEGRERRPRWCGD